MSRARLIGASAGMRKAELNYFISGSPKQRNRLSETPFDGVDFDGFVLKDNSGIS